MTMDNGSGKKCCRYLALKYHLVYESYEEGRVNVKRIATREQVAAHVLTKGNHGRVEWSRLIGIAGIVDKTNRVASR